MSTALPNRHFDARQAAREQLKVAKERFTQIARDALAGKASQKDTAAALRSVDAARRALREAELAGKQRGGSA